MINVDEDALICDLAETYHIYDYKSLPCSKVAIFAVGLRNDSRIKMKMSAVEYPLETVLLAGIADRLSTLAWMQSKDGMDGVNRPKTILSQMLKIEQDKDIAAFNSPKEFEEEKKRILLNGGG